MTRSRWVQCPPAENRRSRRARRGRQPGRTGVGLVIGIVVLLILIMVVLQLHQAFFSETVFGEVATAQIGAMASTIAESAVEEAELALRVAVNDPAHPAFSQFRAPLTEDPSDGFEIGSLSGVGDKTRGLLAQSPYQQHGFALSVDRPRVLFRKLFENKAHNFNEHFGTIRYRAVAKAARYRTTVERVVETSQDYKVVAAGIPPPFDQVPLFLGDPHPLVNGTEFNDTASYFADIKNKWLKAVRKVDLAALPAEESRSVKALLEALEQTPGYETGKPAAGATNFVQGLEFPMAAYSYPGYARANQLVGDNVDLSQKIRKWREEINELERDAESKSRAVVAPGASQDALKAWSESVKKLTGTLLDHQLGLQRWQTMFGTICESKVYQEVRSDIDRICADSLRKRAFFTIDDRSGDINETLEILRTNLRNRTGLDSLNGVLWADNTRSTLRLTGQKFSGRIVIVATGAVEVGDTGPVDGGDKVAVIALGTLTIKGNVNGSLAAKADYRIEAPSLVTGTLLLDKPTSGSLTNLTVRHDPKLSGYQNGTYNPRYFYVGLAPHLAGKNLRRKSTD